MCKNALTGLSSVDKIPICICDMHMDTYRMRLNCIFQIWKVFDTDTESCAVPISHDTTYVPTTDLRHDPKKIRIPGSKGSKIPG